MKTAQYQRLCLANIRSACLGGETRRRDATPKTLTRRIDLPALWGAQQQQQQLLLRGIG